MKIKLDRESLPSNCFREDSDFLNTFKDYYDTIQINEWKKLILDSLKDKEALKLIYYLRVLCKRCDDFMKLINSVTLRLAHNIETEFPLDTENRGELLSVLADLKLKLLIIEDSFDIDILYDYYLHAEVIEFLIFSKVSLKTKSVNLSELIGSCVVNEVCVPKEYKDNVNIDIPIASIRYI